MSPENSIPNPASIAIIGAGFTGLAAAYDLACAGHKVTIFEETDDVGGLAGTFEISAGQRIEKFYHHWFTSDTDVLALIQELGLSERLKFMPSRTGLYYANSIFRLARPFDLLTFRPLPFIDRIRTGLMALKARRIENWHELESQSAEEWIIKNAGRRSFEVIWKPLLKGKFGPEASNVSAVWFWNKLKLRGSSRDAKGAESLVYFEGSFGALSKALRERLEQLGVDIRLGQAVTEIGGDGTSVQRLRTSHGDIEADAVLATLPLPTFLQITPSLPAQYVANASRIRFLGNVCVVLRLKQALSSTYWLNVADPSFPFVGIIEHTNFDDPRNYGNEHIAYLSKYLPVTDAMFKMSEAELLDYCIPFIQRMFPAFSRDWIIGHRVWKAAHSQPVITPHYSKLIPAFKTPLRNLWLSTMAQVYPEDRGTNYAVRYGRRVAAEILADLETRGINRELKMESASRRVNI